MTAIIQYECDFCRIADETVFGVKIYSSGTISLSKKENTTKHLCQKCLDGIRAAHYIEHIKPDEKDAAVLSPPW